MGVSFGRNMRLLAALAILRLASGCYYQDMGLEHPQNFQDRFCLLECATRDKSDSIYTQCCYEPREGQEVPAVCSEMMASGPASCSGQAVQTTDSAGYTAPTSYVTAQPTAVPTSSPVTSFTEGQSISSDTVSTATEWTTTTVSAPCETTTPPDTTSAEALPTPSEVVPTDTCECTDTQPSETPLSSSVTSAPVTTSEPAWTSDTEGEAFTSDVYAGSPPPEDFVPEDQRKKRTYDEKQYTCACAAPVETSAPVDTSVTEGVAYTSDAGSPTTSCADDAFTSEATAGNTPSAGFAPDNERRFLPTIYGPGPKVTAAPNKRTYPEEENPADNGNGAPPTVTSTKTETAPCTSDGAAPAETQPAEGEETASCEEWESEAEETSAA